MVQDLIAHRSMSEEMAQFLGGLSQGKINILISGGTGSGKTTLLNLLSGFIATDERIVTIEDAAELQLQQPHVVRLETRPPNIEGRGEVSQRALVRNALRMRPDRIILGETRGSEALDMLQAMNTGHEGSMTTIHANTARDALARLESMIAMAGVDLPAKAARSQVASAVGVIVQSNRLSDGTRKLTSIHEITGMEGDVITMQEIFSFRQTGVGKDGAVQGYFTASGVRPRLWERLQTRGIALPESLFEPVRRQV
jgi:pilus assembly protein CpaF